jgi:cyclophilin family peptidyl-prolyl cis-trans isomerase
MKGISSFVIVALGVCLATAGFAVAQDPVEPEAKASATPPAAATGDSAKALAEFQAKFEEWKGVLQELRSLKQKFDLAEAGDVAAIREQWNQQVARGEVLIPELRQAGMRAYAAAPKEDRELERFLIKILKDDIEFDRHESAAELGDALVSAGCEVKEVVDHAGVAAFCVNDYDKAEKYLKEAEKSGVLSDLGRTFLPLIPEYREYWAKEQEIRKQEAEKNDLPRVKIATNKGDMVVELFENEAPGAVGNFISLAEKGFYDGLVFHRVLKGFMAQGGCPQGTGSGGPGYNIYCECKQDNHRKHFRGTLSMAHAGRDTGGSQFFATFVPTSHLNGEHTAFGRVIEGMEVLSKLQRIDPGSQDTPKPEPDRMVKVEVLRKRDHEYKPNKVQ